MPPADSCLLVVDAQEGFYSARTAPAFARLERLLERGLFEHILCTRFVNAAGSPFERFLHWVKLRDEASCSLRPRVASAATAVFIKHGYTGVTPEVLAFLTERDIRRVYLAGVDTDGCVLATALSLFEHRIEPLVLAHCCGSSSSNGNMHRAALSVLSRAVGRSRIIRGSLSKGLRAQSAS